jgi:predicted amidohydrolase
LKLALVQFAPEFGQTQRNLDHSEELLSGVEADVIVLPELFNTGYVFTDETELVRLAEPIDGGPTLQCLERWAKEKDCAIAAGWAEATPAGPYNSAVIMGPSGLLSHYRKIHLFDREKLWFLPGNLPFSVISWRGAQMGLMICFDWRFPESARSLALQGADLILHPSNLVQPWCPDAMITRSLENNVYSATANRWGVESRGKVSLKFIGKSQVIDPKGKRLAQLPESEDGVLVVDIDPQLARDKQVTEHNHLWEDRRDDLYVGTQKPVV